MTPQTLYFIAARSLVFFEFFAYFEPKSDRRAFYTTFGIKQKGLKVFFTRTLGRVFFNLRGDSIAQVM